MCVASKKAQRVLAQLASIFAGVVLSVDACVRWLAGLLDDDEAPLVAILASDLLHAWRGPVHKVRSHLHARFKGIVGEASKREQEDGTVGEVCPSRQLLVFTRCIESAEVYRVWHGLQWDAGQVAQMGVTIVCPPVGLP